MTEKIPDSEFSREILGAAFEILGGGAPPASEALPFAEGGIQGLQSNSISQPGELPDKATRTVQSVF